MLTSCGPEPAPAPEYLSTGDSKTDDQLVADGFRLCAELGYRPPSHHRMFKIVRRWRTEAPAAQGLDEYLRITYPDPVGEAVVRHAGRHPRSA